MPTVQTVRGSAVAERSGLASTLPRQRRWAVQRPADIGRRTYWRQVGSPGMAAGGSSDSASSVPPPVVLTVAEACAVLRISKWTLYELIRSRQLRTVKIGARRVIPMSAIHALLDRLGGEEAA